MRNRGKKGISPLIATVILIGFVVAIAAIVMLWGRGFVEETAEKEGELAQAKLACNNVDFKITKISEGYNIENTGSETIDNFIVRKAGGESKIIPAHHLIPWESMTISSTELGPNYEIIPRIKPEGVGAPSIPCSNAAKTIIGG